MVESVRPKFGFPIEPPHPVLQAAGFGGGIGHFNDLVNQIDEAHRLAYGTRVSPGVALDVARAVRTGAIDSGDIQQLFQVPNDPTQARLLGVLGKHGIDPADASTHPTLVNRLAQVSTLDELNDFQTQHSGEIGAALSDPHERVSFEDAYQQALARVNHDDNPMLAAQKPEVAGLAPESVAKQGWGLLGRAAQQIVSGLLLGPPLLAVTEGKAIGKSVAEGSPGPLVSANVKLAKGIATGAVEDVKHPKANAGNLILDILGLASVGAGAAARVGAAGEALATAAEGASAAARTGAVARALLTKPTTGVYHLGPDADQPLSSNPLVARVQRYILNRRANGLTLNETNADPVPAGAAAAVLDGKAQDIADGISNPLARHFSMQSKIGRQITAADKIERDVRLSVAQPLAQASAAASKVGQVLDRIRPSGKLTLGEEKALQVLTTDDPNPLETWRAFHVRAIAEGIGDESAHRAQLAQLEQARKVIANPTPRFEQALATLREVSDEQTRLRIEKLGLAPEVAESRIANVGKVIRGEVHNPAANAIAPALTSGDDILRLAALGRTPEQIARELVAPNPEAAGDLGRPSYSSEAAALKAVRAKLATPEAQEALRPRPIPSERKNPGAAYVAFQSIAKTARRAGTFFNPRPGPFGVPLPQSLPELNHYFTGDIIRSGDFRADTSRLATETYGRTVNAAIKLEAWKRLHDHYSTEAPRTADDIPIRARHAVTEDLRRIVAKADSGQVLTAEDVHGLSREQVDELSRYLLPHRDDVPAESKDFRWVDPRYLGSVARSAGPGPLARGFSKLNEPLRDLTLFVRPAYAMNLLNSAQMALIDQGVFAVPNFVRALRAEAEYGTKATRALDAMAGESRPLSYAPSVGGVTRFSHGMAQAWNRFTDLYFRRAAVIFYLRKAGYRTADQIKGLLDDYLRGDETARGVVTEAAQRGKKSMVELDNLTPFEKNTLRHVIFVYPWTSRSLVWSLKTILDHPAQTDIYAHIAQAEHDELDPILSRLPGWMRDVGYIPIGHNPDGSPRMVNPGSVNTFATLGEAVGLANGDSTFQDLLGPGAELGMRLATGQDRYGRKYAHWYGPLTDVLGGLPQVSAVRRARQAEPAEAPLDVTKGGALVAREHAEAKHPVFVPGDFWNTYGPLILGGLAPRTIDTKAIDARYWQAQPWEKRHAHEAQLIQKMATIQGGYLGKAVPQDVRVGLTVTSARTEAYHRFSQDTGRSPTMLERTGLDIATLEYLGRVTASEAKTLRANLDRLAPDEVDTFRTGLIDKYAYGKQLTDWHRQVTLVARTANAHDLGRAIERLVTGKVLPDTYSDAAAAPTTVLHAYGREFLTYDTAVRGFQQREKEARAANQPTKAIQADLRAYVDEHDTPVVIDGHTFPPLPRLAIAHLTPEQLAAHLADNYGRRLSTLSALDKSLMGLQSSPGITRAWSLLETTLAQWRKQDPARSFGEYEAKDLARQVDKYEGLDGAFVREVNLSYEPRWKQLKAERIYTESPNRQAWDALFAAAAQETANLTSPDTDHAAVRRQWDAFARDDLVKQIKAQVPAFWRELQPYLHANPSFLVSLINKG